MYSLRLKFALSVIISIKLKFFEMVGGGEILKCLLGAGR